MRILLFFIAIWFVGCSTHPMDPRIDFKPPVYVEQMPSKDEENIKNLGSLFGKGDNPLFGDKKAMKVNDIVTVIITEQAKSSSKGTKKLSESDTVSGSMNAGTLNNLLPKPLRNITSPTINSQSSYNGSGQASREESFSTTISARIIKILKNGNYFIEGSREVYVDGQKQIIRLSGVIRPEDIDSSNTIDSKYISDAKIYYETEGDIKESTNVNWFSKILSVIWPF